MKVLLIVIAASRPVLIDWAPSQDFGSMAECARSLKAYQSALPREDYFVGYCEAKLPWR